MICRHCGQLLAGSITIVDNYSPGQCWGCWRRYSATGGGAWLRWAGPWGSPWGRSCPVPAAAARDTGTPEGAVSLEGRPLQPRGGGLRQLSTGSESVQSKDGMITSSAGSGRVCVCVCVRARARVCV